MQPQDTCRARLPPGEELCEGRGGRVVSGSPRAITGRPPGSILMIGAWAQTHGSCVSSENSTHKHPHSFVHTHTHSVKERLLLLIYRQKR